jgi:hypothetical protein
MSDGNSQSSRLLPETDAQERPAACYLRYSDSKLAIVVTEPPSLNHLPSLPNSHLISPIAIENFYFKYNIPVNKESQA